MSGEKAFEQFCAKYGDDAGTEVMERIGDAMFEKDPGDRIKILDVHALNACNHIVDGDIEHAGKWFSFSVESGDRRGTFVREWGAHGSVAGYEPEPPIVYDLMPANRALEIKRPGMFGVYLAWREMEWFRKLAQSYNYDRHFAPGGKTENHYRAKGAERGLVFAIDADVKARIDAFKALAKAKGERA
ncbi:hypothetical protein [Asaia lannensis]|uniref:hypothetical protein n=1 Tax=Asaia lannensis TaxID=415421 RepID=UPI003873B0B7